MALKDAAYDGRRDSTAASILAELKRRNIFRVAVAYLAASWLLVEVLSTVFDVYMAPDWVLQILIALLAVGFPVAILFSWAYEITPEGLKREGAVARDKSITHITAKRLDGITIALLASAVVFVLVDRTWRARPAPTSPSATLAAEDKSIAVLPFEDMSPGRDQEYFADGLTDTLIHVLTQLSGLKVIARTSSFAFKGHNTDVREIAGLLEVASVLEGSVQKAGTRVRIIAQLIDGADGAHIWSRSFDRDLKSVFAVQDEIAREVVRELEVTLLGAEEERIGQRYQPSLEAYEQFILGRQEMARRTVASLAAAERHFKNAIDLDPQYALALVALSDIYALQQEYSGLALEQSLELRRPLIDTALELDPLSGEAYTARASLLMMRDQDESAESDFLRAIELNPNYATAYHWYYLLLRDQGRHEDALKHIRIAAGLDPMAAVIQANLAEAVWNIGRAEEALSLIRRAIDRNPEFTTHHTNLASFLWKLGRLGEAQWWIREGRRRDPSAPKTWFYECLGLLFLRDDLAAEQCTSELSEAYPQALTAILLKLNLEFYRTDWMAAAATLESMMERGLGARKYVISDLAYAMASRGEFDRARGLMGETFPDWLGGGLEISGSDIYHARVFASILHCTGETHRRDALLLAIERRIATMHRIRGIGYGAADVYLHAMRGDRNRALGALRNAIDDGWRRPLSLAGDFVLEREGLLDDPEFMALLDELHADIALQRRWYEDHEDKPLTPRSS